MGIEDMVNKAKEMVGGDSAVDSAVDQVGRGGNGACPDQADGVIDQAAQAVRDQFEALTDGPGRARPSPASVRPHRPGVSGRPRSPG